MKLSKHRNEGADINCPDRPDKTTISKSHSNVGLDPKSLTLDQKGKVLVEHFDGFDSPAELTFECVNGFVHSADYEDLQYLCLSLASELEKERKKNEAKKV